MILENVKESITVAISSSRSSKKKKVNFDTIVNWVADNVENNYEKSLIKTAITTLIEDGTIEDRGKGKGESYFLSQKLQPLGESSQPENAVNIDELINNKVRDALKNHDNISPPSKSSENDIINKYVILIDELKSEITYLREESLNKNILIEKLINAIDKKSPNDSKVSQMTDGNKKEFQDDTNCVSRSNNLNKTIFNINTSNSFEALNTLTETNSDESVMESKTNDDFKKQKNNSQRSYRTSCVLTTSIGKDIQAHKMRQGLVKQNDKCYVKSFNGATINDMKYHVIPSLQHENDLYILHCGSNDLRSEKTPEIIANEITNLAKFMKTVKNDVMISGILERADRYNEKGKKVNVFLQSLCSQNKFMFVDNNNIKSTRHLNGSGLHLNNEGTVTFANNLLDAINL